jgi:hypothetical protein
MHIFGKLYPAKVRTTTNPAIVSRTHPLTAKVTRESEWQHSTANESISFTDIGIVIDSNAMQSRTPSMYSMWLVFQVSHRVSRRSLGDEVLEATRGIGRGLPSRR